MLKKILIVDDDRPLAEILASVLVLSFHLPQPQFAGDGNEGVMFLDENTDTDLIITDLEMPNMDGRDFIQQCRLKFPRIKIILMSGKFSSDDELSYIAKNFRADVAITKPFKASEIQAALKRVMD